MLHIGIKIAELRKQKGWSQNDLAKAIGASRDIIGKYERNENTPSLEMAQKLAEVFGVTVDFILGKGSMARYDKEAIKRLEDIEHLDPDTRKMLFKVIDTFLRDAKARQAYGS
ncbi:helix-turn-helix domain-containing protein [Marinifilum caeruleilacunae]|uniref:XRE family transcriptional regulator n=1 Tax=Marinifilum caeruleilacunae TaxID=2499076 RepID=A0ABX1X1Y1_9BACT|nr:helix-turn-helix transcriptional regulator [Marinifilum caeruleilacunae]NOU62319.1 XRE family transcriptional regulator [Marinifilum caeruleilacunae]